MQVLYIVLLWLFEIVKQFHFFENDLCFAQIIYKRNIKNMWIAKGNSHVFFIFLKIQNEAMLRFVLITKY
jgi:hypothetical protein